LINLYFEGPVIHVLKGMSSFRDASNSYGIPGANETTDKQCQGKKGGWILLIEDSMVSLYLHIDDCS